jgi:hypothetical protein
MFIWIKAVTAAAMLVVLSGSAFSGEPMFLCKSAPCNKPVMTEEDKKIEPLFVLVYYHDYCADLLTPEEYENFRRTVGSSPFLGHAVRVVDNGIKFWGERRYCQILTAQIKQELPEIGKRLR